MPHSSGKKKGETSAAYEKRAQALHSRINALEGVSRSITGGLVKQPYIGRSEEGGGLRVRGSKAEPLDPDAAAANRRSYGVQVKAKRRHKIASIRAGY